jgi:thiol-disulfide isomerase/thioredoxin
VVYRPAPEFRGAQFGPTAGSRRFVVLAIALAFLLWPHSAAQAAELAPAGVPAKLDFSLQDLNGANLSLKRFGGRTILVHFFATWCEPCREELPALDRFLKRSAPDVSVVAVSVAEVDPRVKRFFEATPVDFPVLLDRDRTVAKSWKISTLPTTYVLDASMKPMLVVEADFAWDTVELGLATGTLIKRKADAIRTTPEPSSSSKNGGNDHEL